MDLVSKPILCNFMTCTSDRCLFFSKQTTSEIKSVLKLSNIIFRQAVLHRARSKTRGLMHAMTCENDGIDDRDLGARREKTYCGDCGLFWQMNLHFK